MENDTSTDRDMDAKGRLGITLRSKWHLDELLGVGGMAAVYAATHRNGKRGAVKIMHRCPFEPEVRQRFLREGRIANHVEHDGIVSVLDDDVSEDGSPFLVMELLEGESFSARAARTGNKLAFDVVLLLIDQVLDALAAAHDKGIVHRDIKPENLFFTTDARVKVLDFGIAHLAEPLLDLRATQVGSAMGTPAFMAPEQARGRWDLVGPQSDLWSLGATMFTLLTGKFVHEEESLHELLAATITRRAPSLADALPGAPPSIVRIVDRALEIKLVDRWQDARDMQVAVRAAYLELCGIEMPALPSRHGVADTGPRPTVTSREALTLARASTISSVATPVSSILPRLPRTRRSFIVAIAAAAAIAAASFITLRASDIPRAAAAQRLDITAHVAASVLSTTAAPPVAVAPPPGDEPAASIGKSLTPTGVAPSAPLAARPAPNPSFGSSSSSVAIATTSAPAAAKAPEPNTKHLFDRRR